MEERNRELLDGVIEDRLESVLSCDAQDEGYKLAFEQAMAAVSKQIELDKIDISYLEHSEKLENEKEERLREEEFKKEESRKNRNTQIITFAAGLLLAPIVEVACKSIYANKICKLEQFETFRTTAGRGLSSLFRFKN